MKRSVLKIMVEFTMRYINLVFCLIFLLFISLMLMLFCFEKFSGVSINKVELYENRAYARFPAISSLPVTELPSKFEEYFNDNLPLRSQAIITYRKILRLLGSTLPLFPNFINSSDGNIYYRPELENKSGKVILEKSTLYLLKARVAGIATYFGQYGIPYVLLFAPDKTTVYPDNVPAWAKGSSEWYYEIDKQLSNLHVSNFSYIGLLQYFNEEKKLDSTINLYNKKFDIVHWNGNALELVYNILQEKMAHYKWFTYLEPSMTYSKSSKQVLIAGSDSTVNVPWMDTRTDGLTSLSVPSYLSSKRKDSDVVVNSKASSGCIWMITDSYLYSTHLSTVGNSKGGVFPLAHNVHTFIRSRYANLNSINYNKVVAKYKPNLVLEEFVERMTLCYSTITDKNRAFYVAGEIELADVQLFITQDMITQAKNGKILLVNNPERYFSLPQLMPNSDGRICLMARIHSSVNGRFILHYKQDRNKYKKAEEIGQKIVKGDNYIYLPLYGKPGEPFELSFSFSNNGEYKFYQKPTIIDIFNFTSGDVDYTVDNN